MPDQQGVPPSYEQKHFAPADKQGRLRLVASKDGAEGSVSIHADARLYAGLFDGDEKAELVLAPDRLAYVHLVRGQLTVNGQALNAGDALQLSAVPTLNLEAGQDAEVLVFDLPR